MLRFGPVEIAPEHEPPRPSLHAFWRDLEAIDELQDSGDDPGTGEGDGEGPGSTLPWTTVDVGVERQPLGAPGTMPNEQPGGGYDPNDDTFATDVILNTGEPPKLSDYLARCEEDEDGCEGRTFETMDAGTLNWTEPVDDQGTTVEHKIVKEGGRVMRIERITRTPAIIWSPRLADRTQHSQVSRPIEWTIIDNKYYGCCPQALRRTVEETHVADVSTQFPQRLEWVNPTEGWMQPYGPEDWSSLRGVHMSNRKEITQRYQAEGWLRHRVTSEMEVVSWGMRVTGDRMRVGGMAIEMYPFYRKTVVSETYQPVGGGKWLIHTSEQSGIFRPIWRPSYFSQEQYEPVGADWNATIRSYTVETDQAPPTVTCDDAGAEGETCEERAEREWRKAMDEYQDRMEQYRAGIVNAPPVAMRQSVRTNRRMAPTMGQVASGPAGPGIVVGVSYDGRRSGDGESEDTCGMQLLSRITS